MSTICQACVIFSVVTMFGIMSWYFIPEEKWLSKKQMSPTLHVIRPSKAAVGRSSKSTQGGSVRYAKWQGCASPRIWYYEIDFITINPPIEEYWTALDLSYIPHVSPFHWHPLFLLYISYVLPHLTFIPVTTRVSVSQHHFLYIFPFASPISEFTCKGCCFLDYVHLFPYVMLSELCPFGSCFAKGLWQNSEALEF